MRGSSWTNIFSYKVGYDSRERISSIGEGVKTTTFQYDGADRLKKWTSGGDSVNYGYDRAGNLISRSGEETASYTYNKDDQILSSTVGSTVTTFTHDALGRITRRGSTGSSTTYGWDSRSKLASASVVSGATSTTVSYEYDAAGLPARRVERAASGTEVTKYRFSGSKLVAIQFDDDTVWRYQYAPDGTPLQIVETTASGARTLFLHTDALGSVVGITDETGVKVADYAYDPWGRPEYSTQGDTADAQRNPVRYRGYFYDSALALHVLPFRAYDPALGRFVAQDPAPAQMGSPLSVNRYAYCEGDPVNEVDPSGAVMTDYYRHEERSKIGEIRVAMSRRHHAGFGGTKSWSKKQQKRVEVATIARVRRVASQTMAVLMADPDYGRTDLQITLEAAGAALAADGVALLLIGFAVSTAGVGGLVEAGAIGALVADASSAIGWAGWTVGGTRLFSGDKTYGLRAFAVDTVFFAGGKALERARTPLINALNNLDGLHYRDAVLAADNLLVMPQLGLWATDEGMN